LHDDAVTYWHRTCRSAERPFAVVKVESRRASLWVLPTTDVGFTDRELRFFRAALAEATGVVLAPSGARAFIALGNESAIMARLLAAAERRDYS